MSVVTELKTTAEFDTWISANAALVLAYAEENDVAIRDLPISAREFNTLRLNGIEKISQLVVAIPERKKLIRQKLLWRKSLHQ